jgi:hypothetical protein
MFIWSSKKKERKEWHFFCPKCDTLSPYSVRPASVDFTFYFLPLFEKRDLFYFVVCKVCRKGFDPAVLERHSQTLFKLVWGTKCQLRHLSQDILKSKLLSDGLKEPLVDKLIMMATH